MGLTLCAAIQELVLDHNINGHRQAAVSCHLLAASYQSGLKAALENRVATGLPQKKGLRRSFFQHFVFCSW